MTFSNYQSVSTSATFGQVGTYVIQVSVSDGTLSSTNQMTITVDSEPASTFTLTASAGTNGSISPAGTITVDSGGNKSFTVTPNASYHIESVSVDGSSVGTVSSYAFSNITSNHTISAAFAVTSDTTPPSLVSITVSNVTTNSAAISWTTGEAATTEVKYGSTNAYGNFTSPISSLTISHTATVTNLSPNTLYHYAVISTDAAGNTSTSGDGIFSTPAIPISISTFSSPQSPAQTVNTPPANVIPVRILLHTNAPTPIPAQIPKHIATHTSSTALSVHVSSPVIATTSSTTNQEPMVTLSSSTPFGTSAIDSPDVPISPWSYVVDQIYSFPIFLENIFERIFRGVKETIGL